MLDVTLSCLERVLLAQMDRLAVVLSRLLVVHRCLEEVLGVHQLLLLAVDVLQHRSLLVTHGSLLTWVSTIACLATLLKLRVVGGSLAV